MGNQRADACWMVPTDCRVSILNIVMYVGRKTSLSTQAVRFIAALQRRPRLSLLIQPSKAQASE